MTPDEIVDLLAYIAGHDQRSVGEVDVEIWLDVATDAGWTYPQAKRVVREYHRSGAGKPRITPAAITDALAEVRATIRRRLFRTDITPPRELGGDVAAELAWRRQHAIGALGAAMDDWARDGRLPDPLDEPVPIPVTRAPAEIHDYVERFALRGPRAARPVDVTSPDDRRAKVEAARAELDQIRHRATGSQT